MSSRLERRFGVVRRANAQTWLIALGLAMATSVWGQTSVATSPAVGYNETICLGGSDTIVTAPFQRSPDFQGMLAIKPVVTGTAANLTATAGTVWAVDQFKNTHFVQFTSGPGTGFMTPILGNTATTLSVNSADPGLKKVLANDRYRIVPFWTLATLFPPATQTAFHASTGRLPTQRGSELLVYGAGTPGTNLVPTQIFFVTATEWRQAAPGFPAADSTILPPNAVFVVRHQPSADATSFRPSGMVSDAVTSFPLAGMTGSVVDHYIGLTRPVPVKLVDLGLLPTVFQVSTGLTPATRKDELLVFDNSVASYDKTESARYFRFNNNWYKDDVTFPISNNDTLPHGAVVVIRKALNASATPVFWQNPATY